MNIIDLNKSHSTISTSIGLGNFDGIHIAHQDLIKKVVDISIKSKNCPSILLFKKHTRHEYGAKYLTTLDDKIRHMKSLGINNIFLIDFDEDFKNLSPEDFINKILKSKCRVDNIVVGKDYRFGCGAKGDINTLEFLQSKYKYNLELLSDVIINNSLVSSSLIKEFLAKTKIEDANRLLGRYYSIEGQVIKGFSRGKKLGFPTANIDNKFNYYMPGEGVYYTILEYQKQKYRSMTSIGRNLTFSDMIRPTIEVFIDKFNKNIYGEFIRLEFVNYIRPMIKFDTADKLIEQLNKDYDYIKNHSNLYNI